ACGHGRTSRPRPRPAQTDEGSISMNTRLPRFTHPLLLLALVMLSAGASAAATLPGSAPTFAVSPGVGSQGATMAVQADFNGDGRTDLASANPGVGAVSVFLGPIFTTVLTLL